MFPRKNMFKGLIMSRKFCALMGALLCANIALADPPPAEMTPDEVMKKAAEEYRESARLRRMLDNEAAFEHDFDLKFNVTPEQIERTRRRQDRMEKAASAPVPEAGKTRSLVVSLEPGSKVPVIRCYPQYVTTIRVLDAGGNPWPIVAHMVGNDRTFSVQKPDMEPYDTLMVSPLTAHGSTNITLMLDNNEGRERVPPLSLQLVSSTDHASSYDTVATVRADRRGPRAPLPVDSGGDRFHTDETLVAVLDGVPPKEAVKMKTSDKNVSVWKYKDNYFVRSPQKMIWPAWTRSVASGEKHGGVYAYEMPQVDQIMFSDGMVTIESYPESMNRVLR